MDRLRLLRESNFLYREKKEGRRVYRENAVVPTIKCRHCGRVSESRFFIKHIRCVHPELWLSRNYGLGNKITGPAHKRGIMGKGVAGARGVTERRHCR